MLSPVPFWQETANPSDVADGVYYDLPHMEYVASYKGAGGDTGPTVLRFGSHRFTEPDITSGVTATSDGFLYTYTVSNDVSARQPIRAISLTVDPGSPTRVAHPSWSGKQHPSIKTGLSPSASIDWTPATADQAIAPGGSGAGFTVESTSSPGFVTVTFKGDSQSPEYDESAAATLPDPIRQQLSRVFANSSDLKTTLTIGPRFPRGASQAEVARNFLSGIQVLIRRGKLDAASPFTQSAVGVLSLQAGAGDAAVLSAADFPFAQAKPGLETTIANALKANLNQ